MMSTRCRGSLQAAVLALALVVAPAGGSGGLADASTAAAPAPAPRGGPYERDMVAIPAGTYEPLYKQPGRDSLGEALPPRPSKVAVPGFRLAAHAVTNAEYLAFVLEHPEWRRSRARRLFVDEDYLRHWRGDLDFGDPSLAASPVVNVSWFAAKAYCASRGHALPTVDQWEYVAAASERRSDATREAAFQRRLREWYSRPTPARLARVGSTARNVYGVWDLHGLVWEWTADFGSALVNGESRGDVALDRGLYCGSGATNAADFRDYAAFMRYAFRSSLSARYCVPNLGFREAAIAAPSPVRPPRSRP
jgi:formylglycine-generating enzyme required for sulfatase activity